MGCFTVSLAAAIGVGVARHIVKHHEKKLEVEVKEEKDYKFGDDFKWSKKLGYLELAYFGGSFVLIGEHIIHGEVTLVPPFFTAINEGFEAVQEMMSEIATAGVAMWLLLTFVWAIGIFIVDYLNYRKHKKEKELKAVE